MKQTHEPQAAIYIEETHQYDVELGAIPFIAWNSAKGQVRVEIPYDGSVFKPKEANLQPYYHLGELALAHAETNKDTIPIVLEAGKQWHHHLYEGKRAVCQATYQVEEPGDTLVSVDGVVQDDLLQTTEGTTSDAIFEDKVTYSNPLALHLSIWVPDLLNATRPDEHHELETLILRGESTRRIFLSTASLNFESRLAEHMSALANTAGGIILLGVDRNRSVSGVTAATQAKRELAKVVLTAVLQSTPPIPLLNLAYIKHPNGKTVLRLDIASKESILHTLNGQIYRRQGNKNITNTKESEEQPTDNPEPLLWEGNVEDIFTHSEASSVLFRNQADIVVLDAEDGLEKLRLGEHICGLINAGKRNGRIIVTNLPDPTRQRGEPLFGAKITLESVLEKELKQLLPSLNPPPRLEQRHISGSRFAIIYISAPPTPISLYNGSGYLWQNPLLNESNSEELLQKYLSLTSGGTDTFDDHDVYLEKALLNWPIRPPEVLETAFQHEKPQQLNYDVQYQAQVWEPRPFIRDEDTVGFQRQLSVPLQHVSLSMAEDGTIQIEKPIVKGKFRIRFKDALISGLETSISVSEKHGWFQSVPVYKRTILELNVEARLNELFARRQKSSLLRFSIPDVLLTDERLHDLRHIFADVGFRIYETPKPDYDARPIKTTIRGIRSHKYFDIFLLAGLLCETSELTRELRYEGWRDSKSTFSAKLDLRIKLWGIGKDVEKEIGQLHMHLYRTINQRLQHLHTE